MARVKKEKTLTTAQQLGSIIKTSRDIMRKDKGLNGDLDRLPQLTWLMFLKFLDDMELLREEEATLSGERFKPVIEAPYRWRDWAINEGGLTGDDLINFVTKDEAMRPDGTMGMGLIAYLRSLRGENGGNRRDVVSNVFSGISNRMESGYLLREVINKINGIHFASSEELHTLGFLYESMLREMRDAAGDSGEFYTPRPVIQFIVTVTDPKLGEVVLDPACGTGGFLVEAYSHLEKQCESVQDRELLQNSIMGGEAKPLPYLLVQMNLLLHGMEYPRIVKGNSLDVKVTEIGDKDRVEIIMTNPPFGGEEEAGIKNNFPSDMQTAETALLFLQLIMRKIKRPSSSYKGGRGAVIVPDGILFNVGVAARIKEFLVKNYNLHTIVRLPFGVFEPYTPIRSNILFFDASGPTETTWFYEISISDGRKKYSKTKPLRFEELEDCILWWNNREENERAWKVSLYDIVKADYNIDFPNPNRSEASLPDNPKELMNLVRKNQQTIDESFAALSKILEGL